MKYPVPAVLVIFTIIVFCFFAINPRFYLYAFLFVRLVDFALPLFTGEDGKYSFFRLSQANHGKNFTTRQFLFDRNLGNYKRKNIKNNILSRKQEGVVPVSYKNLSGGEVLISPRRRGRQVYYWNKITKW